MINNISKNKELIKLGRFSIHLLKLTLMYPALIFGTLFVMYALFGGPLNESYFKDWSEKIQIETPVGSIPYERCARRDQMTIEKIEAGEIPLVTCEKADIEVFFEDYQESAKRFTNIVLDLYSGLVMMFIILSLLFHISKMIENSQFFQRICRQANESLKKS